MTNGWMIGAMLGFLALTEVRVEAQDLQKAIDELARLKPGDEAGFDEQADILLGNPTRAVPLLEAKLRAVGPRAGFPLQRVRDMIHWPLDVRGCYIRKISSQRTFSSHNIPLGTIITEFNGTPVRDQPHYSSLLAKATQAGDQVARIKIYVDGETSVKEIRGLKIGVYLGNYPHVLAKYVHSGHRGPAWDAKVKEGLQANLADDARKAAGTLPAAVDAGCSDVAVFTKALDALRDVGAAQKAFTLWKKNGGRMDGKSVAHSDAIMMGALAAMESGDVETSVKLLNRGRGISEKAGRPYGVHLYDGYLAIALQERDPKRADTLFRKTVDYFKKNNGPARFFAECHAAFLKKQGQWTAAADLAKTCEVSGRNSSRMSLDWMKKMKGRSSVIPPKRLFPDRKAADTGRAGGLTGTYHAGPDFTGKSITRIDSQINFNWQKGKPLSGLGKDKFSIRWTGFLEPEFTDSYTFTATTDDGARLWIDGRKIIDHWKSQSATGIKGKAKLTAGRKVEIRMEYFDGEGKASARLAWVCSKMGSRKAPGWGLVYRQNFDVPSVAWCTEGDWRGGVLERLNDFSAKNMTVTATDYKAGFFTWNHYDSCKVEADIWYPTVPDTRRFISFAGVNAMLNHKTHSDIGAGVRWPYRFQSMLMFDQPSFGYYMPGFDFRKKHRVSLAVHEGKAVSTIDGRPVNTQFYPASWRGMPGVRYQMASAAFDNFEIHVPVDKPVDNDRIRGLYDGASAAMNQGDLNGALGAFEQAAAIQPESRELGRLYAAYLFGAKRGDEGARPILRERFRRVADRKVLDLLLHAEEHLGLMSLANEPYQSARSIHISLNVDRGYDRRHMRKLKAASGTGQLAVHARAILARFQRNKAKFNEVEAAYRNAIKRDPTAVGHKLRLARLLAGRGETKKAAALVRQLREALPNAAFLEDLAGSGK